MEDLLKSLSQHFSEALLGLGVAVILLAILTLRTALRLKRDRERWRILLETQGSGSMESMLAEHLQERRRLQGQVEELEHRINTLEKELAKSKRHLGLVRFDAFEDVHGQQSFAIAFYDDQGNGMVMSSIVGRNDCRVYGKPLLGGRSERTLSQEERRAIDEATASGVKSIVSP